jgi:hypothetical protein
MNRILLSGYIQLVIAGLPAYGRTARNDEAGEIAAFIV